ncbi:Galactose oxidase [Quillaja saponaria]|uniref:Galactose oxidase n=1 Tax=Quillaja saponaria TaxID=32244 RepID=A0AAD7VFE3_QUISA|nr:Galactose oxidase [Quillaja saponaria]
MAVLHKVLWILSLLFLSVCVQSRHNHHYRHHRRHHPLTAESSDSFSDYYGNHDLDSQGEGNGEKNALPIPKVEENGEQNTIPEGDNGGEKRRPLFNIPNPFGLVSNIFHGGSGSGIGTNAPHLGEEEVPHESTTAQDDQPLYTGNEVNYGNGNENANVNDQGAKGDVEVDYLGKWEIHSQNSGVSAMQLNLLPTNKVILYDATSFHTSEINLPAGVPCLNYEDQDKKPAVDCFAHSVEYDVETAKLRPHRVALDPWCSSGGLAADGTLVSVGGFREGEPAVRYLGTCEDCGWREHENIMKDKRWYASQVTLANGDMLVVGGRKAYSYEFVPKEGQVSPRPFYLPFLYETSDQFEENNLYPFVHLSTDGNVFIFSNNRSLLLNPYNNKIVRTFPVLPGGSRNYPASGMSALLPIKLTPEADAKTPIPAQVIVCGGSLPYAFRLAEAKTEFVPALQDCGRIEITKPNSVWEKEQMPSRRVMGDMLILPTGDLLLINGAQRGTAAWLDAKEPNLTPLLYNPDKPNGQRFKELKPSQIPRMYHSSSAVLQDGKVLVAGSNTNPTYQYKGVEFPTELRVEKFSPPYLHKSLDKYRPEIVEEASVKQFTYGQRIVTQFQLTREKALNMQDIEVTMYPPPFTTHGYSMNQRLLILGNQEVSQVSNGVFQVVSAAPPSGVIAPPGYYLLFVVHRGVPSKGMWVLIQ